MKVRYCYQSRIGPVGLFLSGLAVGYCISQFAIPLSHWGNGPDMNTQMEAH